MSEIIENNANEPTAEVAKTPVVEEAKEAKKSEKNYFCDAKWYDALVALLIFCLSQVAGGAICGLLAPMIGMELPNEIMRESVDSEVVEWMRFLQSRMVAVSYFFALVVGLSLAAIYARSRGWRGLLSFKTPGWAYPFRLLCGYLLMWCVSVAVEPLAGMLPGNQDALGGGGWLIISAVMLAPVYEEIIFRGYIAGALRAAYGGLVAWIVSAVIFGVAHISPSVMVTATASGLVLGFYYLRYRSLVMVVVLHAMNNITACFLQTIDMQDKPLSEIIGDSTIYWGVYALCCVVTLVALWRMAVVVGRIKRDNIA